MFLTVYHQVLRRDPWVEVQQHGMVQMTRKTATSKQAHASSIVAESSKIVHVPTEAI